MGQSADADSDHALTRSNHGIVGIIREGSESPRSERSVFRALPCLSESSVVRPTLRHEL